MANAELSTVLTYAKKGFTHFKFYRKLSLPYSNKPDDHNSST